MDNPISRTTDYITERIKSFFIQKGGILADVRRDDTIVIGGITFSAEALARWINGKETKQ